MHLVFLTAFQSAPFGPALDRKQEAELLKNLILLALQPAAISADVAVHFGTVEVTAWITVPDAVATFAALAPVLRASPFCKDAYVLLRCGAPGAPEREISLAQLPDDLSARSNDGSCSRFRHSSRADPPQC